MRAGTVESLPCGHYFCDCIQPSEHDHALERMIQNRFRNQYESPIAERQMDRRQKEKFLGILADLNVEMSDIINEINLLQPGEDWTPIFVKTGNVLNRAQLQFSAFK